MILLLDIGNTRLKWAQYSFSDGLVFGGAETHQHTVDFNFLEELFKRVDGPEDIFIANVAGSDVQETVSRWCQKRWGVFPHFLKSEKRSFDVVNAYQDSSQLGVDRWLGLIASRHLTKHSVCSMVFGTAITLDVMDASGQHLGGLILPGLRMMREALSSYTQGRLNVANWPTTNKNLLGTSTEECVAFGLERMHHMFFNPWIEAIEKQLSEKPDIIVSGGDAKTWLPCFPERTLYRPNHILEGMVLFVKKQVQEQLFSQSMDV